MWTGRTTFDNLVAFGNVLGGMFTLHEQLGFARVLLKLSKPGSRLFIDRKEVVEEMHSDPGTCILHDSFDLFGLGDAEAIVRGKGLLFNSGSLGQEFAQYYPSKDEIVEIASMAGFTNLLAKLWSYVFADPTQLFVFGRE